MELLLVIAILAVVAALYLKPGGGGQQQIKARCSSNLQKAWLALDIYSRDFGGTFPVAPGAQHSAEPLWLLIPKYSSDTTIFVCPGDDNAALAVRKTSYAYVMGLKAGQETQPIMSDAQIDTQAKAAGAAVFSLNGKPPGNNHSRSGGNFLFTDGHVESSPARIKFGLALSNSVVLLNP